MVGMTVQPLERLVEYEGRIKRSAVLKFDKHVPEKWYIRVIYRCPFEGSEALDHIEPLHRPVEIFSWERFIEWADGPEPKLIYKNGKVIDVARVKEELNERVRDA